MRALPLMGLFVGPQRLRYSAILGLTSALSSPAATANLSPSCRRRKRNPVTRGARCMRQSDCLRPHRSRDSLRHPSAPPTSCSRVHLRGVGREPAGAWEYLARSLTKAYHNHFADLTPSPCETRPPISQPQALRCVACLL